MRLSSILRNRSTALYRACAYALLNNRLSFEPSAAKIICGDPRGGSTWLSEIIGSLPNCATLWEPLHIDKVRQIRNLNFEWREFIEENAEQPKTKDVFDALLSGKILSSYLCQRTTPSQLRSANSLLVKFCRANQLLPWLTTQYSFKYKPIYLVRHPCAVVASQMKYGAWDNVSPKIIISNAKNPHVYEKYAHIIETVDTIEKRLAFMWCMSNSIPLQHSGQNERWITAFYEDFVKDPNHELNRISEEWKIPFPKQTYERLRQASKTTLADSPIQNFDPLAQLRFWQSSLTSKQIEDVLGILEAFGLSTYSSDITPQHPF